jgi:hypothetical protein
MSGVTSTVWSTPLIVSVTSLITASATVIAIFSIPSPWRDANFGIPCRFFEMTVPLRENDVLVIDLERR